MIRKIKSTKKIKITYIIVFIFMLFFTSFRKEVKTNLLKSKIKENWNKYENNLNITDKHIASKFGNVNGWNNKRASISNKQLRVKLEPNALSAASGIVSNIEIKKRNKYSLEYELKFDNDFDWGKGGKVGFGFGIGDPVAGGVKTMSGSGATFRITWYQDNNKKIYLRPYIYHFDKEQYYGDDFGKVFPENGSIQKGKQYKIKMIVKSNDGDLKNGLAYLSIDGIEVLNTKIRWTNNDMKKKVSTLTFHTFRGGSENYWMSKIESYIFYDNIKLR